MTTSVKAMKIMLTKDGVRIEVVVEPPLVFGRQMANMQLTISGAVFECQADDLEWIIARPSGEKTYLNHKGLYTDLVGEGVSDEG